MRVLNVWEIMIGYYFTSPIEYDSTLQNNQMFEANVKRNMNA